MKRFGLSRITIIILIALILIATIPLYLVFSDAVQSTSFTCKRCHQELYDQWQRSTQHPPSIASCEQCHGGKPMAPSIPPGFSGKNEQLNDHCLKCHQDVVEKATVSLKLIKVSHKKHNDEGMGCLECHRSTAHGAPSLQDNRPPKEACYSCHILEIDGSEKDRSCNMCHHIILSTSLEKP